MKLLRDYPQRVMLGTTHNNDIIYMDKPEWACGWYWQFGWLFGKDIFTHLKYLGEYGLHRNIQTYFKEFVLSDKDLWTFCEIVSTIYTLKECAEVFHRGGRYYTDNPSKDLLIQLEWEKHINEVLIPTQIDELYKVLKL